MTGRFDEAGAVLEEAVSRAAVAPAPAARASLVRLLVSLRTGAGDGWRPDSVEREIADAIEVFTAAGDEAGLAMAWRLLAWVAGTACRFGDAADASERAVEHARRAGDVRQERRAATAYGGAALLGPTNVDEAIARCESCLEQTAGDRQSEGHLLAMLAGLYAMQGSFDHARDLVTRGRTVLEELDLDVDAARVDLEAGRVEMLARDLEAAERRLRRAYEALDAVGEKYLLSTVAGYLAQTLVERGAIEDADALVDRARELATDGDVETQALWRYVRGRTLARRRAFDDAEAIAREALALLEPTDATMMKLDGQLALGEILDAAGRASDARQAYEAAHALAERKGGVVILGTVLHHLDGDDTTPA